MICALCGAYCTTILPGFPVDVKNQTYYVCTLCDWSTDYKAMGFVNCSDYLAYRLQHLRNDWTSIPGVPMRSLFRAVSISCRGEVFIWFHEFHRIQMSRMRLIQRPVFPPVQRCYWRSTLFPLYRMSIHTYKGNRRDRSTQLYSSIPHRWENNLPWTSQKTLSINIFFVTTVGTTMKTMSPWNAYGGLSISNKLCVSIAMSLLCVV